MSVTIATVRSAAAAIAGEVPRTPLIASAALSARAGCDLRLKLENLQPTGSFKLRGALNRLRVLTTAERRRGVIALSAGNHAQPVAYFAGRMGVKATIVMPVTAPFTKVEHSRRYGARVLQHGLTLQEGQALVEEMASRDGLTIIHPYDDPLVVAGQGTVGLEMLEQEPALDVLVVPVGGGGLIAGIAVAAKALNPKIKIIGVQAARFPALQALFAKRSMPGKQGEKSELEQAVALLAEDANGGGRSRRGSAGRHPRSAASLPGAPRRRGRERRQYRQPWEPCARIGAHRRGRRKYSQAYAPAYVSRRSAPPG